MNVDHQVTDILVRHGNSIQMAYDDAEALTWLHYHKVDVLIVDLEDISMARMALLVYSRQSHPGIKIYAVYRQRAGKLIEMPYLLGLNGCFLFGADGNTFDPGCGMAPLLSHKRSFHEAGR